jgi:prepilin-type N-terminal cleavage/methylation domain-containing protein
MQHFTSQKQLIHKGFTLTEILVTTAIVGVLSSIALPNYLHQVNRSRQNEAASTIAQIQTTIATYSDEFGLLPTSWSDLNDINAVMTNNGPATQPNFGEITLAGGIYNASISQTGNLFTITATNDKDKKLNLVACLNLTNGASAINKGNLSSAATSPNCG